MITTKSFVGFANIWLGQTETVYVPFGIPVKNTPIVYHHGAQQDPREMITTMRTVLRPLVMAGYPMACVTSQLSWGNSSYRDRSQAIRDWLGTEYGATGPCVGIGSSMGAYNQLVDAAFNPSEFAGVVGIIPAVDGENIRTNNTGGFRASIDTAWGVTYPAALPAGANPAGNTGVYTGLPIQLWVASNDTTALTALASTFSTAVGAEYHNLGALEHTTTAMQAVDGHAVLDFVNTITS